jgi:phospholipid/cholesterol/gamma-HCH transport system substrate-binding protein
MPPNKKTVGLRELRVGLLVVVSIAVLIFLILNASGDFSFFARKLSLRTRFANADGLRRGAEVRLAGVRVGKVEDISLLPPSDSPDAPKVEVRFSVESEIDGRPATDRIRTDSTAQLGSPGLLGSDKIINITPGTSLGQAVKDNDILPSSSGTDITSLTQSGTELTRQLNELSKQVTDITRKVNEGQGTVGRFVNDEAFYNNLNAAVRDVQEVVRQIRSGQGSAGKFINDPALYENLDRAVTELQKITGDIQRGRGTIGKLATDEALYNEARLTVARLSRSADEINALIADIKAGRGTIGKLVTDEQIYNDARIAIARFNATAERIDKVVASAQRGEGTAGKLLTDDRLYNSINQLSSEGVKLIYDFRQNPKKYLTVKFELF